MNSNPSRTHDICSGLRRSCATCVSIYWLTVETLVRSPIQVTGASRKIRPRQVAGLSRASESSDNRRTTVIVADDDASVRRAIGRHMAILGFEVLVFRSAEELLARNLQRCDVCLLLDVHLPEMSGIELSRNLAVAGQHMPTILMGGSNDPGTRRLMRVTKPNAILFKPFEEKSLLRAIRKALTNRTRSS
jgi:CheY-like chemotaxis protein